MKTYIVLGTYYGDWIESMSIDTLILAVFDSLEKAEDFKSKQPPKIKGGFDNEYEYDENGDVCGCKTISHYDIDVNYRIEEFEIN
jgi:hypothetical protein